MKQTVLGIVLTGLVAAVMSGCSDKGNNPVSSTPPPPQGSQLSFQSDVRPILQRNGCISCHGGSGGLVVGSVADLLKGGNHGPAIVAGNADGSNIIRKLLLTPPFGDRMPQGGPYLADSTIQILKNWINQGAKDN